MYRNVQMDASKVSHLSCPDMFQGYLNLVLKLLKLLHAKWTQILTKNISTMMN
jgi:hypothetical protein